METPQATKPGWLRHWPEIVLAVAATLILLGFLGSPQLWGKREQRAAAETLDTIDEGHWLVARIQGRPRLEKPPLPRWTSAALLTVAGGRSEWLVRLPNALAGLATLALVYVLGRRIGGRSLALTSAVALCTTGMFVTEQRQAGNDGMLGLFTTLALFAAWCTLRDAPDGRRRPLLFGTALGLGFLCKGPIILMIVAATVLPYLACNGRLRSHTPRLLAPRAWLVFLGLAACWPVAVLAGDPQALGVWLTEMGQKTGLMAIGHREREVLGLMFPLLALPWSVLAVAGLALPLATRRRPDLPWEASETWFPWWWVVANLAIFSAWAVAKPHYFSPCLPGLSLLVGMAWLRLCAAARGRAGAGLVRRAGWVLGLQWLLLVASAVLIPVLAHRQFGAASWGVLAVVGGLMGCGAGLAAWIWRHGFDALAPLPIAVAAAGGVLIGYGLVAPLDDPLRGHAALARELERRLPPELGTLRFFHEIDEGLWFYLPGRRIEAVSGSQPRYSDSYDHFGSQVLRRGEAVSVGRRPASPMDPRKRRLLDWLRGDGQVEGFVLLRAALYDHLAADLEGLAVPVYREEGLKRNELVLLRVAPAAVVSARPSSPASAPIRR